MPCLKGFFYTLAFASLALLAVLSISLYGARPLPSQPAPTGSIAYDIGIDVLQFNNVSFEITRSGSRTILTVRDSLPSSLQNPSASMDAYEAFISTVFARRTNHNISLDVPASYYILQPFGFSYRHPSFAKSRFITSGVGKVIGYSLAIRLNKTCLNNDCAGATRSSWRWRASGLFISLDIRDASGNPIIVNGRARGYISKTTTESFQTALAGGGYLNVTVVSGSLRVTASGARAESITNITLTGTPVSQVVLPLNLRVD